MRLVLLGLLLLAALGATADPAAAVGFDACLGRQCVSFHPLPTLLLDGPPIGFDTPFGHVVIVPCV